MIVLLRRDAGGEAIRAVEAMLVRAGATPRRIGAPGRDAVEVVGSDGAAFAKGIAGAAAAELAGRPRGVEAVHRDRLVLY